MSFLVLVLVLGLKILVLSMSARELKGSGIKACLAIYGKIALCFPSLFLTEAMKSNLVFCRSLLMSTPFQNGIIYRCWWPGGRGIPGHATILISSRDILKLKGCVNDNIWSR